ncbi:hypothetical protein B7P43_G08606 [Cryptotermes secundus]|uniref:Uncharacterized protein n=1 Tax=Cryptotermes secundus TaxID=105785 RepID=A0A2J7QZ18_9NEOP|nr:hypothetical protein B7P43_G08606 [Cryptotermes secundus]
MTKEEMKQKPKCPLSSGLLSSPTGYHKGKVAQQFQYLVTTLNLFVSSKQMEIKSCLTHTYIHTHQPQRRLTNQTTPTTSLTSPPTSGPEMGPSRPVGRPGTPTPHTRVDTKARRAPSAPHGSPMPHHTLLFCAVQTMLPVHILDLSFVYSLHRTDIVDSCYVIVAL